jgi:hypothetical protein
MFEKIPAFAGRQAANKHYVELTVRYAFQVSVLPK